MSNGATPNRRRRWVREAHHRIAVEDPSAAQEEVNQANQRLLLAAAGGQRDLKRLEAAVKRAAAKVDKCFATITFRQLPSDDYEALIEKHPSSDEKEAWDEATFLPALAAQCCVAADLHATSVDKSYADLTEDEWAAELVAWALGDKVELLSTVVGVNARRLSEAIPKG